MIITGVAVCLVLVDGAQRPKSDAVPTIAIECNHSMIQIGVHSVHRLDTTSYMCSMGDNSLTALLST